MNLSIASESSFDTTSLLDASQSENTRLAYQKCWHHFKSWCSDAGLDAIEATPEDVIRFFVMISGFDQSSRNKSLALNTLRLYRTGLNNRWKQFGMTSPASANVVDEVFKGLARVKGDKPRRVKALREYQILAMLRLCSDGLHGIRDASALSLGFAAALRRSELCNLRIEDVEQKGDEGILLHIRKSKTDRYGQGQKIAVLTGNSIKPIEHLDRWLKSSKIKDGYIFQTLVRGGHASGKPLDYGDIARIVKRYAQRIGLDPSEFSGHSLRAGFVTSAAANHARIDKIMEITRHKSADMVMKYIRDEDSFVDHAGASFL